MSAEGIADPGPAAGSDEAGLAESASSGAGLEGDAVGNDPMRDLAIVDPVQRHAPPPLRAAWNGDGATVEWTLPAVPDAADVPAPDEVTSSVVDFDAFYLRHRPMLLKRLVRFCARDAPLAEDVVQQTFIAAYCRRDQLHEIREPVAWLFTVASRAAIEHFRRQRMEIERIQDAAPPPVRSSEDAVLLEDLFKRHLTERQRQIMLFRYVEGQRRQWIADTMKLALRTVDSEIKKALDKLRPHLRSNQEES